MDTTYKSLTHEEMNEILGRAHAMRAAVLRSMGQAFGARVKSGFVALKGALVRPVQKAA